MKKFFPIILMIIAIGAGAFYSGMKYGQTGNFQNFRNLSSEALQQRMNQAGGAIPVDGVRVRPGSAGQGGGFISGEIISKDSESLTVKLLDGGSKIVFYSELTEIGKFAEGAAEDIETGKNVTITGQANQDGSITARSIQLRPQL